MTDVREQLETYAAEVPVLAGSRQEAASEAVRALRAVLDIHRPQETHAHYGDKRLSCRACYRHGTSPKWPCDTVAAVSAALTPKEES